MRCLIDTNILIDVLSNRKNFVKESSSIMKFCETKIIDGSIKMSKICANCKYSERVDAYNIYCYKENHFFNKYNRNVT